MEQEDIDIGPSRKAPDDLNLLDFE